MAIETATPPLTAINYRKRRAPKTSELIAKELANYIVDSQLVEGAMLPTERAMVETFGVGRTTLREALRLLETRGVITIRPGRLGGPVVRRPRPEDLSEALTLILQFKGSSFKDVLLARGTLEPLTARLAAESISDEELGQIQQTIDAMLEHLEDHDLFLEENRRFHGLIAQGSGSIVLRVFTETLKTIADGATVGIEYTPHRRKAVAEAHMRILKALRERDPDATEQQMRKHLEEARRYWEHKYGHVLDNTVRWVH